MAQIPYSGIDSDNTALRGASEARFGCESVARRCCCQGKNDCRQYPGGQSCRRMPLFVFSIVVRRFPGYNQRQVGLGWFMERLRATALLICLPPFIFGAAIFVSGQTGDSVQLQQQSMKASPASQSPDDQKPAVPLDPTAPRITKQTRLEIIRDFETQMVYSRAAFPMGAKGLRLKNGTITPMAVELQQALSFGGPACKAGDPAPIHFAP